VLIRGSIRSGAVRQLIAEPRVGMRILSEDELTASLNGKARPRRSQHNCPLRRYGQSQAPLPAGLAGRGRHAG
jgi:hypothetical protein